MYIRTIYLTDSALQSRICSHSELSLSIALHAIFTRSAKVGVIRAMPVYHSKVQSIDWGLLLSSYLPLCTIVILRAAGTALFGVVHRLHHNNSLLPILFRSMNS